MNWKPLGKFVLVRLNTVGSMLELTPDQKYDHTGEVLGVGAEVVGITVGDTVLINGPQGVLAHPKLGEDVVLVAAPLLLAVRMKKVVES